MVSIIIKTLNEEDHIGQSIRSTLRALDGLQGEIIVADSLSTDQTIDIARQFPVTIVQITDPRDRRCGIGPQLGYQYCSGDFIYILDGDMELQPGFIEEAISTLQQDDTLGGVAGLVDELGGGNYEFEARKERQLLWSAGGLQRSLGLGGLYRREALESVDYFSDRNLHANEELELGCRLWEEGWRLVRLPLKAITHHGHSESTLQLLRMRWRNRRSDGPGELLRVAWGKPYFRELLFRQKHLLATLAAWVLLLSAVLLTPLSLRPLEILTIVTGLAILVMIRRKRSTKAAFMAILSWQMLAGGLVRGFLSNQVDPRQPVSAVVIKANSRPWEQT